GDGEDFRIRPEDQAPASTDRGDDLYLHTAPCPLRQQERRRDPNAERAPRLRRQSHRFPRLSRRLGRSAVAGLLGSQGRALVEPAPATENPRFYDRSRLPVSDRYGCSIIALG